MRFPSLACGLLLAASVSAQSPTFSGQVYGPHFAMSAEAIQVGDFNGRPALMVACLNNVPSISWHRNPTEPAMWPGVELRLQHLHVFNSQPCAIGQALTVRDIEAGNPQSHPVLWINRMGWNPPIDPSWPVNPTPQNFSPPQNSGLGSSQLEFTVEPDEPWYMTQTQPCGFAPIPDILFAVFDVRVL